MPTLKTAKAVREHLEATQGIVNEFGLLLKGDVVIRFTPLDRGRGGRGAHWTVQRYGFRNNPGGEYYERGHKTFWLTGQDRESCLQEAITWARERYNLGEFVKDPWGCSQPHSQLDLALTTRDIYWTALENAS